MYLSRFYSALCLDRLCNILLQIGIVESLLIGSGRRHAVPQIIIQIQGIWYISGRSEGQVSRTLFAALYIDLQSVIGFSMCDPGTVQRIYDF